jgi:hypothetical protein
MKTLDKSWEEKALKAWKSTISIAQYPLDAVRNICYLQGASDFQEQTIKRLEAMYVGDEFTFNSEKDEFRNECIELIKTLKAE